MTERDDRDAATEAPGDPNGDKTAENGRDRQGRFAKGAKPGPGRPRGQSPRKTLLAAAKDFDAQAAERLPEIVQRLLDAAAGGDLSAAKLVLDRVAPPRKAQPVEIDLPDTSTLDGIGKAQDRVLAAVAAGEIAPEEAKSVMGLLEDRRRVHETEDIEQRLAVLEQGGTT